ncbi:MAG: peptidase and matrixin and adamalysin [Firmicutes bacterium]|nr:peptidase and matrixin and adamalysin [Bacillota bacterium]
MATLSGGAGNDFISASGLSDTINGNAGNDILYGNGGDDIINGGLGSDTIDGGVGNDIITYDAADSSVSGGTGTDTLTAATVTAGVTIDLNSSVFTNFEKVIGSNYNDTLTGTAAADTLWGGGGHDIINGGAGDDIIDGGAGNDTIIFDAADNWLYVKGGTGIDTLDASAQTSGITINTATQYMDFENIIGGSGNDTLVGNAYSNVIIGGAGDDAIDGGAGNDTIVYDAADTAVNVKGGLGIDLLDASLQSSNLSINLTAQYTDFENVTAGDGNDTLTGNALSNILIAGAGDDILDGKLGADTIDAGAGDDTIIYDVYDAAAKVKGGDGTDTLDASSYTKGAAINLSSYTGIEILKGSSFNDTLTGSAVADELYGNSGNDSINGGAGADKLYGGDGNDSMEFDSNDTVIDGGAGVDTLTALKATAGVVLSLESVTAFENITGGNYNDMITGDNGANVLLGGAGNDVITGGAGVDTIDGGAGNDTVIYDAADNPLNVKGGAGIDLLDASAQISSISVNLNTQYKDFENIVGGSGDDTLVGNSLANVLRGGSGSDSLDGGAGNDLIYYDAADTAANIKGGLGIDTLDASEASAAVTINLSGTFTDFENATGGTGNDTVTGNVLANVLKGRDGDDTLEGGAGNDTLDGGIGADQVSGGAGDDLIVYSDDDIMVDGGEGIDTITGALATAGLTIDFDPAIFTNIEKVIGSKYNDTINGNNSANNLSGGEGDDVIDGKGGNDIIDGGNGNDIIIYDGADGMLTVKGGAGVDTLDASAQTSNLAINLNTQYKDFENIIGGSGNDTLVGNALANRLVGGAGSDTLDGGAGNDIIVYDAADILIKGGLGVDTLDASTQNGNLSFNLASQYTDFENLIGGSGNDALFGNTLANELYGGAGNDTLDGKGGADKFFGGDGDDTMIYGATAGKYDGGSGFDVIDASNSMVAAVVDLNNIKFAGIEKVIGSNLADTLTGGSANEILAGGGGNDKLTGGAGDDELTGGAGNDTLSGGAGNDIYWFGAGFGKDIIVSDAGNAGDTIKFDFAKEDLFISRSGLDLVIGASANDTVTIKDWYKPGVSKINTFEFDDGTVDTVENQKWASDVDETGTFNIEFDYRFDTSGWFNDPTRRATLEAAADLWESIITDEFADTAAGTVTPYVTNPQTGASASFTTDYVIDDVVVFVGARELGGSTLGLAGPSGWYSNTTRYTGTDFEPWIGTIAFDTTTNWFFDTSPLTDSDIPSGQMDFITVATHELGHVLGIGGSNAWKSLISGSSFIGTDSTTVYGGLVPLSTDKAHAAPGILSGGDTPLMNPYATNGVRYTPTELDKSFLADIGYQIV